MLYQLAVQSPKALTRSLLLQRVWDPSGRARARCCGMW